jgi:phage terminase large subunit-like protein
VPDLLSLKNKAQREGWAKYIRSDADEHAMLNGCRFKVERAERVCKFFRTFLRHSKGEWAGQPFELLDWQREDLIYPLFGWERADKTRRFRKAYVELPKKNGKSTLASGIGLYMLAGDGERGAEVYSAATDQKQASIVHNEAINMVDASPALSAALRVNRSTNNIAFPSFKSYYRSLSSEAAGKEGLNAHSVIADELHVWYGRKLWDALRYAFRARQQGLLFVITTAGDDMQSVCRQEHDYAERIISGQSFDDRYFAYIRCAAEADDLTSPEVWRKANPSMGITINEAEFGADVNEAMQSPSSMAAMKRYSFNIWTTSTNPAIKAEDWNACKLEYAEADLEGQECYAGLDLGRVNDMSALLLLFPVGVDEAAELPAETVEGEDQTDQDIGRALNICTRFKTLSYFWQPEHTIHDRQNPNANSYQGWLKSGHLMQAGSREVDSATVLRDIVRLKKRFDIRSIAYDPTFASALVQSLEQNHNITPVTFSQSVPSYAAPCVAFEKSIIGGRMGHNGHPILGWHIGNLNFWTNSSGYRKPVKPNDNDHRKIDGASALIMAVGAFMVSDAMGTTHDGVLATAI